MKVRQQDAANRDMTTLATSHAAGSATTAMSPAATARTSNHANGLAFTHPELGLRPINEADLPFLAMLYASTRQEELQATSWPAQQQQAFLQQQFSAQHHYYQTHIPHAHFDLILRQEQPIGRLYLAWEEGVVRLVDIALLPEQRGLGLGSFLIKTLMQTAKQRRLRIDLHVENHNPAYRLYERLGFVHCEDRGVYQLLSWPAAEPGRTE